MNLSLDCRHRFHSNFKLDVQVSAERRVCGLYGPSGCGKSSLVRLLAGVWRAQQARVQLGDQVLCDSANGVFVPPERRGFGVVFQDQHLFPHLTVDGNLRYAARRARASGAIARSEVIEVLRLTPLLPRWPGSLSGGERQRVAIGRALLAQPRLLLLDEPLAAVDAAHRVEILEHLSEVVARWDLPLLLVSHDQSDLRRLADEVFVLRDGRCVAHGRPDLLSDPRVPGDGPIDNVLQLRAGSEPGQARLGDAVLQLPPSLQSNAETLFARVHAGAIALSAGAPAPTSIRNQLSGPVITLVRQAGTVFVQVDVGQLLWVAVTPAAADELGLQEGALVQCLIKTHSLRPLG